MAGQLGFEIEIHTDRFDLDLFSESQGRVAITVLPSDVSSLKKLLDSQEIPFTCLGKVTGSEVLINDQSFGQLTHWDTIYQQSLTKILEQ